MLKQVVLKSVLIAFLCSISLATHARADDSKQIDVPAGDLITALKTLARQSGIDLVYRSDQLEGLTTHGVSGSLTPQEAVTKLLEGTTLELRMDAATGAMLITTPTPPSQGSMSTPPTSLPVTGKEGARLREGEGIQGEGKERGFWGGFRLAQNDQAQPSSSSKRDEGDSQNPPKDSDEQMGEVIVTGSRLRRTETEAALPVNVYSAEDIEKSGRSTLTEFLSTLNEVSVRTSEGAFGASLGLGTVQLRGLPLGTTLVLINGRRVQPIGGALGAAVFDLNLIPAAAIDRIEIVPVGSSAVYGGDALGGVVNIILKRSADTLGIDLAYGDADGMHDIMVSAFSGGRLGRGTFLLFGAYDKREPLTAKERSFFLDADYTRFGGPDARLTRCTPGTVTSTTGANLPGLNSPVAGIPSGITGRPLTTGDFVPTAGQPNLCSDLTNGKGEALLNGRESVAVYGTGDYPIGDAHSFFGEVLHSDVRGENTERGLLLNNVLVPASNAFNPFGEAVRVTARLGLENGKSGAVFQSYEYTRGVLGLRGRLIGDWNFETAALYSRDVTPSVVPNLVQNTAARTTALGASSPDAALNPFAEGRAASDDVLRSIWSDDRRTGRGERSMITAFARGPAATLPAGSVDIIVGAELAREEWEQSTSAQNLDLSDARKTNALFAEARVPLMSRGADTSPKSELAALTLAGRWDDYSGFDAADTYQVGLEIRPVRSTLVRAVTASSFKPPSLLQLNQPSLIFPTELFGLIDPARGNEPIVGGQVLFGGAAGGLEPERGEANSFGVVLEPESASGLRIAASAWQIDIRDLIVLLHPQTVLNNEALFPGLVVRGPSTGGMPGPVTRVSWQNVNFGRLEVEGTDLEVAYALSTAIGEWRLSASATRTSKYEVTLQPGAQPEDRLGKRDLEYWAPKWKASSSVQFARGGWGVGVTARYLGSYVDTPQTTRELGDTWTWDLVGSLDLKESYPAIAPGAKRTALSLAIVNVADRLPPFAGNTSPFYDSTQADWRGRYVSVRMSVGW